jgi:hypothetical protein
MPRRGNISAGRRPAPEALPVGAPSPHPADATNGVTFTILSEAQWQAIRSTRNWPGGRDWRGTIDVCARRFWEEQGKRKIWIERLGGRQPAREKEKVYRALLLTGQLQYAWTKLAGDVDFTEDDLPDPGLKLREERLRTWLSNYDSWVTRFRGKSDPIQELLEWKLMIMWVEAGGELDYSRKKNDAGTPYGALVDFLSLTLEAVLGKKYQPSGIAAMIDRHRPDIALSLEMFRRGVT